jgi:hypothetical protein
VLLYAFLFGQGLMFVDENPRRRTGLISACSKIITMSERD